MFMCYMLTLWLTNTDGSPTCDKMWSAHLDMRQEVSRHWQSEVGERNGCGVWAHLLRLLFAARLRRHHEPSVLLRVCGCVGVGKHAVHMSVTWRRAAVLVMRLLFLGRGLLLNRKPQALPLRKGKGRDWHPRPTRRAQSDEGARASPRHHVPEHTQSRSEG